MINRFVTFCENTKGDLPRQTYRSNLTGLILGLCSSIFLIQPSTAQESNNKSVLPETPALIEMLDDRYGKMLVEQWHVDALANSFVRGQGILHLGPAYEKYFKLEVLNSFKAKDTEGTYYWGSIPGSLFTSAPTKMSKRVKDHCSKKMGGITEVISNSDFERLKSSSKYLENSPDDLKPVSINLLNGPNKGVEKYFGIHTCYREDEPVYSVDIQETKYQFRRGTPDFRLVVSAKPLNVTGTAKLNKAIESDARNSERLALQQEQSLATEKRRREGNAILQQDMEKAQAIIDEKNIRDNVAGKYVCLPFNNDVGGGAVKGFIEQVLGDNMKINVSGVIPNNSNVVFQNGIFLDGTQFKTGVTLWVPKSEWSQSTCP